MKLPGAKRRGFLREKPLGAAAPQSPTLPFIPTASGGVFWLFPIKRKKFSSKRRRLIMSEKSTRWRRPLLAVIMLIGVSLSCKKNVDEYSNLI